MELKVLNDQGVQAATLQASDALFGRDYNEARPHSGIGRMPPAEFAAQHRLRTGQAAEIRIV